MGIACLLLVGCNGQSSNTSEPSKSMSTSYRTGTPVNLLNTSAKSSTCDDGSCCDDAK
jgi:hypothetical protein